MKSHGSNSLYCISDFYDLTYFREKEIASKFRAVYVNFIKMNIILSIRYYSYLTVFIVSFFHLEARLLLFLTILISQGNVGEHQKNI